MKVRSPLEDAASACMRAAAEQSSVWRALIMQDAALLIRRLPGWDPNAEPPQNHCPAPAFMHRPPDAG